jgi:hypothetical protein
VQINIRDSADAAAVSAAAIPVARAVRDAVVSADLPPGICAQVWRVSICTQGGGDGGGDHVAGRFDRG